MSIEAVIFDWAGTTIDYGCFAPVQAFISAFEEYGITPTAEEVRKPMGMLKRDHIRTMMHMERIRKLWKDVHCRDFTETDIEQVYKSSESGILNLLDRFTLPKPYVTETVQTLREQGIKIGSTTGYTDEMMEIVVPYAKENGYSPDCWFSPNAVQNLGRPYPYMIFKNLQTLQVSSVHHAIKAGDTIADIKEGKAAGMISIGIIEGSSVMGLSQEEYELLSVKEQEAACQRVHNMYKDSGADYVIQNMKELPEVIKKCNENLKL